MDTTYFNQALAIYRAETGDNRPVEELPTEILSALIRKAQQLKEAAQQRKDEPTED